VVNNNKMMMTQLSMFVVPVGKKKPNDIRRHDRVASLDMTSVFLIIQYYGTNE
jgi:hypothetical protein